MGLSCPARQQGPKTLPHWGCVGAHQRPPSLSHLHHPDTLPPTEGTRERTIRRGFLKLILFIPPPSLLFFFSFLNFFQCMFNDVIGFTLDSLYIDFANPFFLFGCATASYGLLVPYLCVCVCVCVCDSVVSWLCATPWSVHGLSRQEYWSGLPLPSPGNLPDPGIPDPGSSLCPLQWNWGNITTGPILQNFLISFKWFSHWGLFLNCRQNSPLFQFFELSTETVFFFHHDFTWMRVRAWSVTSLVSDSLWPHGL